MRYAAQRRMQKVALERHAASRQRSLVSSVTDGLRIARDGRWLINFGGNDYLGIAAGRGSEAPIRTGQSSQRGGDSAVGDGHSGRPRVSGASASSLLTGWTDRHDHLAGLIRDLERCEAAVVTPSGYAACSGAIAALAGPDDLILSDRLNHASLIDGCRLSPAEVEIYPHRDIAAVEAMIHTRRHQYEQIWVVTDGVFSMDGTLAPLRELGDVTRRTGAALVVDEAHGTGVLGLRGGGACDLMEVHREVLVRIGTLSKAVGSQGGFIAGPTWVIDHLINHCRPLIYSTALHRVAVEDAIEGLGRIRREDGDRARVQQLAIRVRRRLGLPIDPTDPTGGGVPIIPVVVGDDDRALMMSRRLRDAGMYVPAIRPPTVPEGRARLRITVSAGHTDPQIDRLCDVVDYETTFERM